MRTHTGPKPRLLGKLSVKIVFPIQQAVLKINKRQWVCHSNMASRRIPVAGIVKFISENISNCGSRSKRWSMNPLCLNTWRFGQRAMSTVASEDVKSNNQTPVPDELEKENVKLKSDIEILTKETRILTDKTDELENKYKRALADGENMRRRLMKQIEDAKLFGIQGFCKDLLEVADILAKATESVPKEEVQESNPHLKSLYEGLMMTEAELKKVFKRHGLVAVSPLDEKFNPNLHEALFQQEVQGKEPGTVVVVSKIGYKLHERVVRPALVGVAKSP